MTDKTLVLWFRDSGLELFIPFSNNPIYEMQKDLANQWIEAEKKRNSYHYTQLMNCWSRPSIVVNIRVETQDDQLSWKNLDDKTLMSIAELTIPFENTVCRFKGYLRDFTHGSHFNFNVTHTLGCTDKYVGVSVSENNIFMWTDVFPKEFLEEK